MKIVELVFAIIGGGAVLLILIAAITKETNEHGIKRRKTKRLPGKNQGDV